MKTEKAYFEKGNGSPNFSLLYPKGAEFFSDRQNSIFELSPAAAHDLQLDDLIAAFTTDRSHQREIQDTTEVYLKPLKLARISCRSPT